MKIFNKNTINYGNMRLRLLYENLEKIHIREEMNKAE